MQRRFPWALILVAAAASVGFGQETKEEAKPPVEKQQGDPVSEQATQLEAELGKYKDSSPEAAEVMVKLADLYHRHGRVFGLIRITRRFTLAHPTDERHKATMLKLIDALEATSRRDDLLTTGRQFLARYGSEPESLDVDNRITDLLDRMGNQQEAAQAYEQAWERHAGQQGLHFGAGAARRYMAINNQKMKANGAAVAEAVFDKAPQGDLAAYLGWQAVHNWRSAGDWAKSNAAAKKLNQAGYVKTDAEKWNFYQTMANNYANLGQHANAAEGYARARQIRDTPELHHEQVARLYNAGSEPAEIKPVVDQFVSKYPQDRRRFYLQSLLAQSYLRAEEKEKGLQLIAALLPHDATHHNQASTFVAQNGAEPAQLAESEKVLKNAVAKNSRDAEYLRYVLAFDLYRDRMKDTGKMRATLRNLLRENASNSRYSQNAVHWLLNTAPSDAEFNSDVDLLLKLRVENLHLTSFAGRLAEWVNSAKERAKKEKDQVLKQRVARVTAGLAQQNSDDFVKGWLKHNTQRNNQASKFRYGVIQSGKIQELSDPLASALLGYEAYYSRHYLNSDQRHRAVDLYAQLCERFPKRVDAAYSWVESAYHYGAAEKAHEAVEHFLSIAQPTDSVGDWYYLIHAADRSLNKEKDSEEVKAQNWEKNKQLVARVVDYINKVQEAQGLSSNRASTIGDILKKYEMEDRAVAYWKAHATDPSFFAGDDHESHLCALRYAASLQGDARVKYLQTLIALDSPYYGAYVQALANHHLHAGDIDSFVGALTKAAEHQRLRGREGAGYDEGTLVNWISSFGVTQPEDENTEPRVVSDEDQKRVYDAVAALKVRQASAIAELKLLAVTPNDSLPTMERLLRYHRAAMMAGNANHWWDQLIPYANALLKNEDYLASATLVTGLLANIPSANESRKKRGRELVAQSYSRIGAVGLTIDDDSPVAPLLQAALMLRLGDRRLALEGYMANQNLFDEHREEMPVDFILFVCESHIAAGGDENFDRVEDILRTWLIRAEETQQYDAQTKAKVQLLLARNFFKARRFDIARSEFTTVKNRYPDTPEALEAEFGIGETFMAQKVYDQAEAVFEKLAGSRENEVVIRAQFLRGVLAYRRGDVDEARDIFRSVLERVPDESLANRTLFELARVYELEERFTDQLTLLRTVGRLGRYSKRWHKPGDDLSIVIQDNDLGISRGHTKIPVQITTKPGDDRELIYLTSGGAGKGLFRADLRTRLGQINQNDNILQLSGDDVIYADYPQEFKADFKHIPLSDVEIRIAADAEFDVASSLIVDEEEESFSEELQRELEAEEEDQRVSQNRPANQVKPGNQIYLRVKDADRDLSDEQDQVVVKLSAQSGDEVQVTATETEPHSGVFVTTAPTAELPAGAIATDSAIQHNPLMAIDRDLETYWLSEPDGATPKELTIDMKDLKLVSRVRISSPETQNQIPIRGQLYGSNDGRFWFRLASNPPEPTVPPVAGEFAAMRMRVYPGNYTNFSVWKHVVDLTKNSTPALDEEQVSTISWAAEPPEPEGEEEDAAGPHAAVWHGKLLQERAGAMRIAVQGVVTAVVLDGRLELPLGKGGRTVDVWLESGAHDLTVFSATNNATAGIGATRARASLNTANVALTPFVGKDFDLSQPIANVVATESDLPTPSVATAEGLWEFRFAPIDLRYVRFVVQEYLGDAVAINNVVIAGESEDQIYIPTEADVLALATNEVLEIAGGDIVTATYTDDRTQLASGQSRLLTKELTATYFDAEVGTIAYDFIETSSGTPITVSKDLMRIDPGERFIVRIVDYDKDQTDSPDTVQFQVIVNDGAPVQLTATETEPYSGIFTKEVDTSAEEEAGKLRVVAGDRIYCRYIDSQNTFPGHSVPRETVLYVRQPTEGNLRILESRYTPPDLENEQPGKASYLPPDPEKEVSGVAFEVPLTVEVIDRDAAKDSRSTVEVTLTTTDGAEIPVVCEISSAFRTQFAGYQTQSYEASLSALEEGRFIGQVIMQLGGKDSPDIVPLSADMPRNLIGTGKLPEDSEDADSTLVTRVLNVTGKDLITATYQDELRPGGSTDLDAQGRLITNGVLRVTDRDYNKPVSQLHVGEKMFLLVQDADRDQSDERDTIELEVGSQFGEKERIALEETFAHSGIFSGSVELKAQEKPAPENLDVEDPFLETYFGDTLLVKYVDPSASTEDGQLEQLIEVPVVVGTDGVVAAFSKSFNDEKLAVETQFHIAECYFELFKSHKSLGRDEEQQRDLQAGRRILREVMEDYPDPKYVPRVAYLLGQFAQELGQYDEAIESYEMIVRQYPNDSLAPDAQYKLAQCYEEAGDFEEALEAYVTLAATYPKSPLIANVMIRISDYFYKKENYEVAAQVGEKFLERFAGHEHAARIAFRVGQAYYKGEMFNQASDAFDLFAKRFPDDGLCADALFWSGESYRMANDNKEAFRRYNRCRWDFPASEAAKYARGRLTLPEMLNQFEQEASALENE